MKLEDYVRLTGTPAGRQARVLRTLVRRKFLTLDAEGNYSITPEGLKIAEEPLYGYRPADLYGGVLLLREWLSEQCRTRAGEEIEVEAAQAAIPGLKLRNKKIGMVLESLGCVKEKRGGRMRYTLPAQITSKELRDLTRVKLAQLKASRETKTG